MKHRLFSHALTIPDNIPFERSEVLKIIAVDFFYSRYPHNEKDYNNQPKCPNADKETGRFFKENNETTRELDFLSGIASTTVNISNNEKMNKNDAYDIPSLFLWKEPADEKWFKRLMEKIALQNNNRYSDAGWNTFDCINNRNAIVNKLPYSEVLKEELEKDNVLCVQDPDDDSILVSIFIVSIRDIIEDGRGPKDGIKKVFKTHYYKDVEQSEGQDNFMLRGKYQCVDDFFKHVNQVAQRYNSRGDPINDFTVSKRWVNYTEISKHMKLS